MSLNPIQQKISALRSQLTRWVLVRGIGQWLLIAIGVLILDMLLDRVFKMDLTQRMVMLGLMGIGFGVLFIWKILRPLWLRPTDAALVYEVQRKHPELKESVIAALQLERTDLAAGVSTELIQQTIRQGHADADKTDFTGTLNVPRHRFDWTMLAIAAVLACVIGWGCFGSSFLNTWFCRNVLLTSDQWPRQTYLSFKGVQDGQLQIPRGSDYRQLVMVAANSSVTDVKVSIEIENPIGRSIVPMKRTGGDDGREHVFMFHNVSADFRMRASGGDDTTQWITVTLVEPPIVEDLVLESRLPEYTGIVSEPLSGPGPFSILQNSRLQIRFSTNMPVAKAAILSGSESFAIPVSDNSRQTFQTLFPTSGNLTGGDYQISLETPGGVKNSRKPKFQISIKPDKPPIVRASLLGISGLVVPRATIPVSFQVDDEYGIEKLSFRCNWKTEIDGAKPIDKQKTIEFATSGQPGLLVSPAATVEDVTLLELTPLGLLPGTSFRFSMAGKDFFPGADNTGTSQEFLLRVVNDAELRSDLLRREIEQRQSFDQAYQAQLLLNTELQSIVVRQRTADQTEEDFLAAREQALITAAREQKSIGTRVIRIANRFEDFLVEVQNNKLDEAEQEIAPEQRLEIRFDSRIIQPIRQLDENDIAMASQHLDHCRSLASDPDGLENAAAQAEIVQQQILEKMKTILSAMNDSENFQEIINQIISIRKANERIIDTIESGQQPPDDLDEDSIFD